MLDFFELSLEQPSEEFLHYLKDVPWGAAKMLRQLIETNTFKKKKGKDARIFYARIDDNIAGFVTLVNQDYIPLPQYDRFIAMLWIDPAYRGQGLARKFISYAEEASGVDTIYIVTRHKGLYEKMGYSLKQEFTGYLHDKDYLYGKELT